LRNPYKGNKSAQSAQSADQKICVIWVICG
jgi:hypothetical protein